MSIGLSIEIDHPVRSKGANPDVISISEHGARGYALKTVRAKSAQTVFERIAEGVNQIERAPVANGMVVLNVTPRIDHEALLHNGVPFLGANIPILMLIEQTRQTFRDLRDVIPETERRDLVRGKKALPILAGISFAVASCLPPGSEVRTATPLKVLVAEGLYDRSPMPADTQKELLLLNRSLQMVR
jgi:hypothetical protein